MRFWTITSVFFFMLGCGLPVFWLAMVGTLWLAWRALKRQNRLDNEAVTRRAAKQADRDHERAVRFFS